VQGSDRCRLERDLMSSVVREWHQLRTHSRLVYLCVLIDTWVSIHSHQAQRLATCLMAPMHRHSSHGTHMQRGEEGLDMFSTHARTLS